jgi:hypothetical protein
MANPLIACLLKSRPFAWRLVEVAAVIAITLSVGAVFPRASSAPAGSSDHTAPPTRATLGAPDELVTRVYEASRPGVVFLTGADAVPVSFLAGGPASDTPGLGSAFVIDDLVLQRELGS